MFCSKMSYETGWHASQGSLGIDSSVRLPSQRTPSRRNVSWCSVLHFVLSHHRSHWSWGCICVASWWSSSCHGKHHMKWRQADICWLLPDAKRRSSSLISITDHAALLSNAKPKAYAYIEVTVWWSGKKRMLHQEPWMWNFSIIFGF